MKRYSFIRNRDRILFVDTETTGIPLDSTASYKNIDNWPNILQIAWIVYKKDGTLESSYNYAISSDTASLSLAASGYVPKRILPIHLILDQFLNSLIHCDVIVGHNIEYDVRVILCELYRYGKETSILDSMQKFCTMKNSVYICGFDTIHGDRYPKLQELYSKLFHQPFDNAHDAYCDIKATADCFWRMVELGLLNLDDFPYLMDSSRKAKKAKEYFDKAEQSLAEFKSRKKGISIYSDACDALGISPILASLDNNEEKIINYICKKYHIKANDYSALSKLLAYDSKVGKEEEIRGYDEPLVLFKKAAEYGDEYSMYRIGHLYYYDLDDKKSAVGWYIKAIEHGLQDMDCYFEYANVRMRLYGSQDTDAPRSYAKWGQMCECRFETISRRHLDLYIEALEYGRYGKEKDIKKAIDVCIRALSQTNPDFGRIPTRYGVRYKLATLYEQIGELKSAIEQYIVYIQELEDKGEYAFDCYGTELKLIGYFFEGKGIGSDYTKAKHYIDIVLSDNPLDPTALYYLGRYYEDGLCDCPKDVFKAFECYEKAAKEVPEAMRKIGIMFLYGIGCEKSQKQARAYLSQAKSKGLDVSPYLERANSWLFRL